MEKDSRWKTEDVKPHKIMSFDKMNLKPDLLKGIQAMGFEAPSPVQEESIPSIIRGEHVLARAKNGTGKTAAYLIPILQRIDTTDNTPGKPQALILVPSRELALQTSRTCYLLGEFLGARVMVSTGGTELTEDILRMKQTVHVLVATPGRALDLLNPKNKTSDPEPVKLMDHSGIKVVVLDEADKLLSDDVAVMMNKILTALPPTKQVLLFSATFPASIKNFSDHLKPAPKTINVMDELTLKGISEYYMYIKEEYKVMALTATLSSLKVDQAMIFVSSSARAARLAKRLFDNGFSVFFIHSRMKQEYRNKIFHDFRSGHIRHLVCTDLFTRGIDVQTVNVVINFDFPRMAETYLHRIGRSGRFGHLGIAISLVTDEDKESLTRIEYELATEIHAMPQAVDHRLYVREQQQSDLKEPVTDVIKAARKKEGSEMDLASKLWNQLDTATAGTSNGPTSGMSAYPASHQIPVK